MSDDNKKPWENDEDFNPEKAWTLIQNLRGEVTEAKKATTTERQAREAAEAELAKGPDPDGKIKAAEERAANAEKALWTARAIGKHPSLAGNEDLLVGADEEAVMKVAERLASLNVPKKDDTEDTTNGGAGKEGNKLDEQPKLDASGRPIPALKPGHGGDDSTPIDPAAIALAVRRH